MIKAIVFDCFGVLTQDGWKAFLDNLPTSEGVESARELNHKYDAGLISLQEFLRGVKEVTGHNYDVETSGVNSEVSKNTTLIEYVKKLKKKYKIAILSNIATNWVRDSLLTKDEQALFDAMVFSFEAGTTKPDPNIYLEVVKRLNIKPQEAVFIDDIERYCEAARKVGMKAIRYENFPQMKTELEKILASSDN